MKPWLRKLRTIWVISGAVFTAVFIGYNLISFRPSSAARAAATSDRRVEVARAGDVIHFTPAGTPRAGAIVFFAGALVDPAAYAPLLRRIAEHGHTAVAIGLPARVAPTRRHEREAIGRAISVMEAAPGRRWVVAGHSKGGAIAAILARDRPESLAGLLLVGTSHPRDFDLSALDVPVVKVFGTRDGLASEPEIREFATNLPEHARFVEVDGANHAQFGHYGRQIGDRRAEISREAQQDALLVETLALLARIEEPAGSP